MASNNRIFYACQAVYVDDVYLHNVQAIGLDYGADINALSDTGRTQRQINLYSKPEITITRQIPSILLRYTTVMRPPIY